MTPQERRAGGESVHDDRRVGFKGVGGSSRPEGEMRTGSEWVEGWRRGAVSTLTPPPVPHPLPDRRR